uniref:Uncharacterized protein n=1 Tax=Arundo donax TaxID=35708 RepID=A0A0A9T0Z3_ARUDO
MVPLTVLTATEFIWLVFILTCAILVDSYTIAQTSRFVHFLQLLQICRFLKL